VNKIMQDYALSLLSDGTPAWPQGVTRVVSDGNHQPSLSGDQS
jgi:hypothetical protein